MPAEPPPVQTRRLTKYYGPQLGVTDLDLAVIEHYHSAQAMTGDGLSVAPLLGLAAAIVIASGAALYWCNRRDL